MKKLLLLLLLLPGMAKAVILTVCSSGCDYTQISSAVTAAGSADIIEIQENITEEVDLTKNVAGFQGNPSTVVWDGIGSGTAHTIDFNTGVTQAVFIRDLIIDHSSGGAQTIRITGRASGQKITLERVDIRHSSTTNTEIVFDSAAGTEADNLVIKRCIITGSSGDDGFRSTAGATANMYTIQNSIFQKVNKGVWTGSTNSNSVLKLYNNTIVGNAEGFETACRGDYKNNVFANNTSDINFVGSSNVADLVTNAFEEQTDTGGFGTGNVFGITSTDEFVNESADNYHVKSVSSQIYNAGTDLTSAGVTVDYDNIARPQATTFDIGAYEFVASNGAPTPGSLSLLGVGR